MELPYPEGFRKWVHIKTSLTGFGKVPAKKNGWLSFHYLPMKKPCKGTGQVIFPDGSIIVFDKHNVDTSNGVIKPGSRKFINMMYKDSAAFKDTGGWGFEEFTGDSRTEGQTYIATATGVVSTPAIPVKTIPALFLANTMKITDVFRRCSPELNLQMPVCPPPAK